MLIDEAHRTTGGDLGNFLRAWVSFPELKKFNSSDGEGYVGCTFGDENLLGRWMSYSLRGYGDNRLLRSRKPRFRFTILQRVSPDLEARDVIKLENSWKERLHTRKPYGLNEN